MPYQWPVTYERHKTTGIRRLFSVSKGVGQGMPNDPLDVVMIQLMLNKVLKGQPELSLDGECGPKTRQRIVAFQKKALAEHYIVETDGKIGPVKWDWEYGKDPSGRMKLRTMVALTILYHEADMAGSEKKEPLNVAKRFEILCPEKLKRSA